MQVAYKNCPLCEGNFKVISTHIATRHPLWHEVLPPHLEWCKCDSCEHIFTRYYWDKEGLKQVFLKANEGQLAGGDIHHRRITWAPTVDRIVNQLGGYQKVTKRKKPATWLDVGFGNGALIATAQEYGFDAYGIDARQEAVDRLNAIGYKAICSTFEDLDTEPYSVISMCDVLEHMPYPRTALKKAKKMLEKDGVLSISLPNSDSSHWKLMGKDNPYWIEIEHYHNFSRQSLEQLLNEEGFEMVEYSISQRYIACMEVFAKHAKKAAK